MTLRVRGIQHLNLTVRDVARSQRFYEDVLGFSTAFAKNDTVWLDAGGDLLGLSEGEADAGRGFHHFGFMVEHPDEVDTWNEQLRTHGVRAEKGPYDRSDGRSVYFRDPDGHLLEIFYVDPAFLKGDGAPA